jgi:hypothetical protein
MSTISERWEALCDQLDSAVEAWQRNYRLDATERDAAYGQVIEIGESMRACISEMSDATESSFGSKGLPA